MGQKGFIFDVNKCTGCSACQLACTIENQVSPQIVWRQINTFNPQKYPDIPVFHHSLACNHCIDPPCMAYCPALAFSKDPVTGAVTLDDSKCIGCKYCSWACPYDAPQYNISSGVMEKCTFCAHRLDEGLAPACVAQCPTGALEIGEYEIKGDREVVVGFPSNGTEPAIEFVPLSDNRVFPECVDTAKPQGDQADRFGMTMPDVPANKVTLRSEWTLVLFTIVAAFLVGVIAADVSGSFSIHPALFAATGLVAMFVSTLHLGRWKRAPRAVLNLRRSWLSREVALFPVFLFFGVWYIAKGGEPELVGVVALGFGFAALFSIDRVYSVTKAKGLGIHSAGVVLTGLLVVMVLTGLQGYLFAGVLLILKTVLYAKRKYAFGREKRDTRLILSAVRLAGSCTPVLLWVGGWKGTEAVAFGLVALGELVDRCEFYIELEIPTPRGEMARELRRQLIPSKKAG